jgi:hypothetical protein
MVVLSKVLLNVEGLPHSTIDSIGVGVLMTTRSEVVLEQVCQKRCLIEWCCLDWQSHIVEQEGYHQYYREHVGTTSYDRYFACDEMKIIILVIKFWFTKGKNITMFGADPWHRSPLGKLVTSWVKFNNFCPNNQSHSHCLLICTYN